MRSFYLRPPERRPWLERSTGRSRPSVTPPRAAGTARQPLMYLPVTAERIGAQLGGGPPPPPATPVPAAPKLLRSHDRGRKIRMAIRGAAAEKVSSLTENQPRFYPARKPRCTISEGESCGAFASADTCRAKSAITKPTASASSGFCPISCNHSTRSSISAARREAWAG